MIKKPWLIASFSMLLCGCAGWQNTAWKTVDMSQKASEGIVESALPVINSACKEEAQKCADLEDQDCPGYKACSAIRHQFVKSFIMLQIACADAEAAIAIANEEDALDVVADVLRLLQELRVQLRAMGVL